MSPLVLIPAAGGGLRFGGTCPKQYLPLNGRPVLAHVVDRLASGFAPADRIRVLLSPDDAWYERTMGSIANVVVLRCGGASRAETVRNGLAALDGVARPDDWIAVHDAVRPCVDVRSLARLRIAVEGDPVGGLLAIPVTSSLKRSDDGDRVARSESRDHLWQAQTPQVFRYGVLVEALRRAGAEHATDEAQAVEALGHRPRLVLGSPMNVKITYPDDLALAEALLQAEERRLEERKRAVARP